VNSEQTLTPKGKSKII